MGGHYKILAFLNKEDNVLFTTVITGYKDIIHNWGIMTGPIWQHWFVQQKEEYQIISYSVNRATHRFILIIWTSLYLAFDYYNNNNCPNQCSVSLLMNHDRCLCAGIITSHAATLEQIQVMLHFKLKIPNMDILWTICVPEITRKNKICIKIRI